MYATLPAADFIAAWRAVPAAALERLAEMAEAGLEPWQPDHLAWFAIRVGARLGG